MQGQICYYLKSGVTATIVGNGGPCYAHCEPNAQVNVQGIFRDYWSTGASIIGGSLNGHSNYNLGSSPPGVDLNTCQKRYVTDGEVVHL